MYVCFQLINFEGTLSSQFQAVGFNVSVEVTFLCVLLISIDTSFRKKKLDIMRFLETSQKSRALCNLYSFVYATHIFDRSVTMGLI